MRAWYCGGSGLRLRGSLGGEGRGGGESGSLWNEAEMAETDLVGSVKHVLGVRGGVSMPDSTIQDTVSSSTAKRTLNVLQVCGPCLIHVLHRLCARRMAIRVV